VTRQGLEFATRGTGCETEGRKDFVYAVRSIAALAEGKTTTGRAEMQKTEGELEMNDSNRCAFHAFQKWATAFLMA
jgi:hypothetical protein